MEEQMSDHAAPREVSSEQLAEILKEHRKYVESNGKTGKKADLRNTDLRRTIGLLERQLAGVNLSRATLPETIKFEGLANIAEASKNARQDFLFLLLGCVYAWLSIATTTDVGLLTDTLSAPLPIIGTAVPSRLFYAAMPLLLFSLYLYFHLSLQRLWEGLAALPAVFPDGSRLDTKVYPWLPNGLVCAHLVWLRNNRPFLSRFQSLVSAVLVWWVVPFTLILFWGRYLRRHDLDWTIFHIVLLVASIGFGVLFQRRARMTLRGKERKPYRVCSHTTAGVLGVGLLGLGLFFLSFFGAIDGRSYDPQRSDIRGQIAHLFALIGYPLFADLAKKELSIKPPNWQGEKPEEIELIKGADFKGRNLQYVKASSGFFVKADLEEADLKGAQLDEADLRHANLRGAKLLGKATLRKANLEGAQLDRACLHQADLSEAKLLRTSLNQADLQGATLIGVNLQGVSLRDVNLEGASLIEAKLQGSVLTRVNLERAKLSGAKLDGTDLKEADLRWTDGLTLSQVQAAKDWQLALYNPTFLATLGLPADHNETVEKTLDPRKKAPKEESPCGR